MISAESFPVISTALQVMAALFVVLIGLGVLTVIILFVIDVTQTKSAIRRNYPVVGRFHYFFEHMGEFFRQYFFAMDREELPFNRAQRSWAYRTARNVVYEAGIIAHSCGVREPRQLKRFHARVVTRPLIRHYHLNKDN